MLNKKKMSVRCCSIYLFYCCHSIVNAKSENAGLHSWLVRLVRFGYIDISQCISFSVAPLSLMSVSYTYIFLWRCRWLGVRWYTPLVIRIHTKYLYMYCVSDGMNCGSRNIYVYNVCTNMYIWCDGIYTRLHYIVYISRNLYGYKHTHRISYIKT